MAWDCTPVSPVMPCIAATKAEKQKWGRTCWEKHLVWVKPGAAHKSNKAFLSYTAGEETTSSNIFWVDESCRCQNVCNTKWHIHEHAPSNFTIVFSHVAQTNSNTRLLPDIISQAIKRSRRIFPTMTPFIVKNLLLPLRPVMNKRENLFLLIVNTLRAVLFYSKSRNRLDVLLVLLTVPPVKGKVFLLQSPESTCLMSGFKPLQHLGCNLFKSNVCSPV